jgi:hypothetical protein
MSPSWYSVIGTATHDAEAPQTMVLDAWWHLAMAFSTIRHAGWCLQNRRMQVRFLSHLPCKPWIYQDCCPVPQHIVYALTPI